MFYTYQQFETLKIQNQFEVRCIILMAYSVTLVMKKTGILQIFGL